MSQYNETLFDNRKSLHLLANQIVSKGRHLRCFIVLWACWCYLLTITG